jgi:hypothetical protein
MGQSRTDNTGTMATVNLTRIIQSLYYSPASRCEIADRGRSIIQVTLNSIHRAKTNKTKKAK